MNQQIVQIEPSIKPVDPDQRVGLKRKRKNDSTGRRRKKKRRKIKVDPFEDVVTKILDMKNEEPERMLNGVNMNSKMSLKHVWDEVKKRIDNGTFSFHGEKSTGISRVRKALLSLIGKKKVDRMRFGRNYSYWSVKIDTPPSKTVEDMIKSNFESISLDLPSPPQPPVFKHIIREINIPKKTLKTPKKQMLLAESFKRSKSSQKKPKMQKQVVKNIRNKFSVLKQDPPSKKDSFILPPLRETSIIEKVERRLYSIKPNLKISEEDKEAAEKKKVIPHWMRKSSAVESEKDELFEESKSSSDNSPPFINTRKKKRKKQRSKKLIIKLRPKTTVNPKSLEENKIIPPPPQIPQIPFLPLPLPPRPRPYCSSKLSGVLGEENKISPSLVIPYAPPPVIEEMKVLKEEKQVKKKRKIISMGELIISLGKELDLTEMQSFEEEIKKVCVCTRFKKPIEKERFKISECKPFLEGKTVVFNIIRKMGMAITNDKELMYEFVKKVIKLSSLFYILFRK